MITLTNKIIKSIFHKNYEFYEPTINEVLNNINLIDNFSPILEVTNITKTNNIHINDNDLLYMIKIYETIISSNNYDFLTCPRCKGHNFTVNSSYRRNIVLHINDYLIDGKINFTVLECDNCKKEHKHDSCVQHYHALLPESIYPYHIYSSSIILSALNDKMNKIKNEIIMEKYRISRQLFKSWLDILNKYKVSSSTILKSIINLKVIIKSIIDDKEMFHHLFYTSYFHPFFLNRVTCVPLAITL